jgi:hypothetical protein
MPRSLLALAVLLAACSPWTKPGAGPDQLAADRSACNDQALAEAPLNMTSMADAGPGPNAPGYSCIPNRGCIPTGGQPGGALNDRNAAARSVAFNQCMQQRGWSH